MHGKSKRILAGISAVIVVLGVIYGISLVKSKARLRAAYAALEENGRPMNPIDIVPPEVQNADNAAPSYEEAARLLKAQPAPKKDLLEYLAMLCSTFLWGELEPDKLVELKTLLRQEVVASALLILEDGSQHTACRFDYDYDAGLSQDMLMATDLYNLAHVWWTKACLEAEGDVPQRPWDKIQTLFRFAEALRGTPILDCQMTRSIMVVRFCRIVQQLCETVMPNHEDYQKIAILLQDLDDVKPFVHALDAERLLKGEWLFNLPLDQLYTAFSTELSLNIEPPFLFPLVFRYLVFKPRFVTDHATYLQLMDKGTLMMQAPYAPPDADIHKEIRALEARSPVTNRLAPMTILSKETHSWMSASVRITRAGLALLQHRKIHGTFPPTLDVLGLPGPIDPFVQEILHYRSEGEGFVVYSVGEDRIDNKGQARQPGQKTHYDIVWRFSNHEGEVSPPESQN